MLSLRRKSDDAALRENLRTADIEGQIAAIGRSKGVIEFALDGTSPNAPAPTSTPPSSPSTAAAKPAPSPRIT